MLQHELSRVLDDRLLSFRYFTWLSAISQLYLLAIVLSVLLRFTDSDYPFGIFWPLCCLFFFDLRILITHLVSSDSSFYSVVYFVLDFTTSLVGARTQISGVRFEVRSQQPYHKWYIKWWTAFHYRLFNIGISEVISTRYGVKMYTRLTLEVHNWIVWGQAVTFNSST